VPNCQHLTTHSVPAGLKTLHTHATKQNHAESTRYKKDERSNPLSANIELQQASGQRTLAIRESPLLRRAGVGRTQRETGRGRVGRGRRGSDVKEGVRPWVFFTAVALGPHQCGEAADEAERVPGKFPPGNGRGGPQHGHAIRHALRLPRDASSASGDVENPPETSSRRLRAGAPAASVVEFTGPHLLLLLRLLVVEFGDRLCIKSDRKVCRAAQ
jgi:hypothetical protein